MESEFPQPKKKRNGAETAPAQEPQNWSAVFVQKFSNSELMCCLMEKIIQFRMIF